MDGPLAVGGNFYGQDFQINTDADDKICSPDEDKKNPYQDYGLVIDGNSNAKNVSVKGNTYLAKGGVGITANHMPCTVDLKDNGGLDFRKLSENAMKASDFLAKQNPNMVMDKDGNLKPVSGSENAPFTSIKFDSCNTAGNCGVPSNQASNPDSMIRGKNYNGPKGVIPSDKPVIINIPVTTGTTLTLDGADPGAGLQGCNVIYHAYPVDDKGNYLANGTFLVNRETEKYIPGLFFAPRGTISESSKGGFEGQVIAQGYTANGQKAPALKGYSDKECMAKRGCFPFNNIAGGASVNSTAQPSRCSIPPAGTTNINLPGYGSPATAPTATDCGNGAIGAPSGQPIPPSETTLNLGDPRETNPAGPNLGGPRGGGPDFGGPNRGGGPSGGGPDFGGPNGGGPDRGGPDRGGPDRGGSRGGGHRGGSRETGHDLDDPRETNPAGETTLNLGYPEKPSDDDDDDNAKPSVTDSTSPSAETRMPLPFATSSDEKPTATTSPHRKGKDKEINTTATTEPESSITMTKTKKPKKNKHKSTTTDTAKEEPTETETRVKSTKTENSDEDATPTTTEEAGEETSIPFTSTTTKFKNDKKKKHQKGDDEEETSTESKDEDEVTKTKDNYDEKETSTKSKGEEEVTKTKDNYDEEETSSKPKKDKKKKHDKDV
ncbi:hypothetical protein BDF20DRAFT_39654 [Mycotypha africana]|uniref:uncharacterized protein n=1 Tax=Mycotypha africana TaxID=64632 RepID=UPI002300CDD0|nr:uncharacterized protein BDF20DRAFT_39654 [Mycotypha africana]KAI8991392.1 hypothetical protein BDF20DRAFT_39654 [Mycotypha africana]